MPVSRVAIVVAMARELAPLLRGVKGVRYEGVTLYEVGSAVVAVGGIGRAAGKRAAEVVVGHAKPEILVSAGVAGALRQELKVGDLVIAREVVDAESDARFRTNGGYGVVVTSVFISGEDEKRALRNRCTADVVDMEASAVAAVADTHGIEFAAVKAVSDVLGFVMPPLDRFVNGDGQFATARFVAYVAFRPRWWNAVRTLDKNTSTASVNLSRALEHLIQQHTSAKREENVSPA